MYLISNVFLFLIIKLKMLDFKKWLLIIYLPGIWRAPSWLQHEPNLGLSLFLPWLLLVQLQCHLHLSLPFFHPAKQHLLNLFSKKNVICTSKFSAFIFWHAYTKFILTQWYYLPQAVLQNLQLVLLFSTKWHVRILISLTHIGMYYLNVKLISWIFW